MKAVIYAEASGEIVRQVDCPPTMIPSQCLPGENFLLGDGDDDTHYVSKGVLVAFTPEQALARANRPPYPCAWSNQSFSWLDLRDIEQVRAATWDRIKRARDAAEFSEFSAAGVVFDGDSESQRRIQGAVQLASLAAAVGQPFGIAWTLADNSTINLDSAGMVSVGQALANHVATAHEIARQLRAQVQAATTVQELEAIQWPV